MRWCHSQQHTATHCTTLQHSAPHCTTLHHTATHCNTLQRTATHCNTLQLSCMPPVEAMALVTVTHCSTLQHTATHCNTLQHTATHLHATGRDDGSIQTNMPHLNRSDPRNRKVREYKHNEISCALYVYIYVCIRIMYISRH